MRVLYAPQRSDDNIEYTFDGEKITATINGQTDIFDLSSITDKLSNILETTLPISPVIDATRVNGVLEVVLISYIGQDATESEKFPDWVEV